jgi:hypothetical protein
LCSIAALILSFCEKLDVEAREAASSIKTTVGIFHSNEASIARAICCLKLVLLSEHQGIALDLRHSNRTSSLIRAGSRMSLAKDSY